MLRDLGSLGKERKLLGISQRELAKMAGVSQSLISKVENGQLVPNYDVALRIIRALELVREKKGFSRAKEIMSSPVVSVSPKDNLRKAISLMEEHGISQLPVISNGKVVGSLTEETIINKMGSISMETPVEEVMGSPFPIFPSDTSVALIKEALLYYQAVLIQENGGIVGIITKSDLVRNLERI